MSEVLGLDEELIDDNPSLARIPSEYLKELENNKQNAMEPWEALSVADALSLIAGREKFADCKFIVGKGKERRALYGHRCILASASDIFEAMLYPTEFSDEKNELDQKSPSIPSSQQSINNNGGKNESDNKSYLDKKKSRDILTIHLPDIKPAAFKQTLQLLYSDSVTIQAEDLPALMVIANKFHLAPLRTLIGEFLEEGITKYNALTLFGQGGELLGDEFTLQFIEENAEEIFLSSAFEQLPKDRLIKLLRSDRLSIDEIDIFNAVQRWALHQLKKSNKKIDDAQAKQSILSDIIPLVRFPLMSAEEISIVASSGLLSMDQLCEIYTYLGQVENYRTLLPTLKNKQNTNDDDQQIEIKEPQCKSFSSISREGATAKWKLDATCKSAHCTVLEDGYSVKNTSSSHGYILGTHEMTKGQHAWRIYRDSGPTQWILIGVSRKQAQTDNIYTSPTVWGMSGSNQLYMAGISSTVTSNFHNGPIDILLDISKHTLTIYNHSNAGTYTISALPEGPFVPCFGPHSIQQITTVPLPVKKFGDKLFTPKIYDKIKAKAS